MRDSFVITLLAGAMNVYDDILKSLTFMHAVVDVVPMSIGKETKLLVESISSIEAAVTFLLDLKDRTQSKLPKGSIVIEKPDGARIPLDKADAAVLRQLLESGQEEAIKTPFEAIGGGSLPPSQPRQRFLQGRFPERVGYKDPVALQVRVALQPGSAAGARLKEFHVPPEGAKVKLVLHCPGFTPQSATVVSLHVPAEADSDWALFELEAEQQGIHTVEVSAYLNGAYLGTLALQVTIDNRTVTGPSKDQTAPMDTRMPEPGEVTLQIRYDDDEKVYRYLLIDHTIGGPDEVRSAPMKRTPEVAIENLVNLLNAHARGQTNFSADHTRQWLKNKGIELWKEFIPVELQKQFWERRDRIKRINIITSSDGDPVPWEVLYPFQPGSGGDGFLAEMFPIARWQFGPPAVSRLRMSQPAFIWPDGSPATAEGEIRTLRDLFGMGETIKELTPLLNLLKQGGFDLLHFACHNSFQRNQPTASYVQMGAQHFEPTFLEEHEGRFRTRAPLVFMNACRTDGMASNYTRLVGWASKFLAAGAGAFIGTLWEVRDVAAGPFADAFYQSFRSGTTLGEAMRTARAAIQDRPGDPTWLAYTLYGDPAATLIKEN